MNLEEIKTWCAESLMFKNATQFQRKDFGWFFVCDGLELMAVVNAANGELIGVWDA